MASDSPNQETKKSGGIIGRFLDYVEWTGNKLPDPAVIFIIGLFVTWGLSAYLSGMEFTETKPGATEPIKIVNMLTGEKFATFLTSMVEEFYKFPPLGIVLVALLGVGVAEHSGFINACLKSMLNITPKKLLTPMLLLVAIVSHTAADAGYVLVIPIGGVMFYAAGRHPLAGIACAFAGVSGGFSANFIVSGIDPLLSSLTQVGVNQVDPNYVVNPLCNILFTGISCIFIVGVGWFLTDKIIEPRLQGTEIDGDPDDIPKFDELTTRDKIGMNFGLLSIVVSCVALGWWAWPQDSVLRDKYGSLTTYTNKVSDLGLTFAVNSGEGEEAKAEGTLVVESVTGLAADAGIKVGDELVKVSQTNPDGTTEEHEFKTKLDYMIFTRDRVMTVPANFDMARASGGEESSILTNQSFEISAFKMKDGKPDPIVKSEPGAPLMKMIVPLIFLIFVVPGLVHGYISGKFKSHRDAIKGMSNSMETMGYYLVLVFFAALFIAAFKGSNIGDLVAIKGANYIKESGAPPWLTIVGMILLVAAVNLLIGSASAKWTMLAPIMVPMLMYSGLSPELTQAAYRVGDSTTNIITPMMPYFPLVVVFCQRYVKKSGIGTLGALMLPYSVAFLITWTVVLIAYWQLGLPLGIPMDVPYECPQYVIDSAG